MRKLFWVYLTAIFVFSATLWPIPIIDRELFDPATYFTQQLGKRFKKSVSEFLVNGIKISYLKVDHVGKEDSARLFMLLKGLELTNGYINAYKNFEGKRLPPPVPFFDLPFLAPGRRGDLSIDYLLSETGNTDRNALVRRLVRYYAKQKRSPITLFGLLHFAYCMKWIDSDNLFSLFKATNPVIAFVYKKFIKPHYNEKRREEECYSDIFEKLIEELKPSLGISINSLKKVHGRWTLTGIVIPELKLQNFLPVITPGKYYLPATIPEADGCGEVLPVLDVKSFRGRIVNKELHGRFTLGVSENEDDEYLVRCVGEQLENSGWSLFNVGQILGGIRDVLGSLGSNITSTTSDKTFVPVVNLALNESGAEEEISDVRGKIDGILNKISNININKKNFKFYLRGEDNAIAIVTGGSMEVRISKKVKKKFSTLLIMEVR